MIKFFTEEMQRTHHRGLARKEATVRKNSLTEKQNDK
jgi:hypothetical protein